MTPGRLAAKRTAQLAALELGLGEDAGNLLGRVREHAALDGLHDDDGLVVRPGHLVAAPALHGRVVPVRVVDLELYELHLRVGAQQLVELLGRGVEREASVLDETLLPLLGDPVPHAPLVKEMRPELAEVVKEVEVEVACARLPERGLELGHGVLTALAANPGSSLGGQLEALARVALDERLADGLLASRIGPGGVEVGESGVHEQVDHLLRLLDVDGLARLGQAHEAKSQPLDARGAVLVDVIACHECPSLVDASPRARMSWPGSCPRALFGPVPREAHENELLYLRLEVHMRGLDAQPCYGLRHERVVQA